MECHWVSLGGLLVTSHLRSGGLVRRIVVFPPSQSARTPRGPLESMRLWMTRRVRLGPFKVLHGETGWALEGFASSVFFVRVFFWSPSIGKRPFFQIIPWWFAWKPRNPVKGKGSERSYSYFYQLLRLMKRQKLLLTSLGSCFFTGKKTHQFLWRNLVVWNEKICIFFFKKHWKQAFFGFPLCFGALALHWPSYCLCSPPKNPPMMNFSKTRKTPGISLDQSLLWSYQDGGLPGGPSVGQVWCLDVPGS